MQIWLQVPPLPPSLLSTPLPPWKCRIPNPLSLNITQIYPNYYVFLPTYWALSLTSTLSRALPPLPPPLTAWWIHPLPSLSYCAIPPPLFLQTSPQHLGIFDKQLHLQNSINFNSSNNMSNIFFSTSAFLRDPLIVLSAPSLISVGMSAYMSFLIASWAHLLPPLSFFFWLFRIFFCHLCHWICY